MSKLDNAGRNGIEKTSVVRDEQACARVVRQKFFRPFNRLRIEVVRWLIKNEQVGTGDDCFAQRHTPLFPAGERGNIAMLVGCVERMHRGFNSVLQIPSVTVMDLLFKQMPAFRCKRKGLVFGKDGGDVVRPLDDVLVHRECGIELKVLREITGHDVPAARYCSRVRLHDSRDALQQCRLARAVVANQPDSVVLMDGERRTLQDDLFPIPDG